MLPLRVPEPEQVLLRVRALLPARVLLQEQERVQVLQELLPEQVQERV